MRPRTAIMLASLLASGPTLSAAAEPLAPSAPTRLDPVTVTASKTERPRDQVPATIDVIDEEEIERTQPQNLGDLLRLLPSVDFSGGDRSANQSVNIRGFGGNRVVTTIDGARQNFDAGHRGNLFLDPSLLKQVEVLKGTNSTLHGSGAIGGVVALTTKDAADFLAPADSVGFSVKTGYHSGRDGILGSGTVALRPLEQLDLLASLSYRDSGAIRTGDGTELVNSAESIANGLVKLGINPAANHRLELSTLLLEERSGLDAPLIDRDIEKQTFTASYAFTSESTDLVDLHAVAYRDNLEIDETRQIGGSLSERDLATTGFDVYNTSRVQAAEWMGHAFTYGVEFYHDKAEGRRDSLPDLAFPDAKADVWGIYLQDEITLFDDLGIVPGVRYDSFELTSTAGRGQQTADEISPRVGVNWAATDWFSVYGSWSTGFRAPSLLESFVGGLHFPGNVFVPNPDLRPESTETWEGGARLAFDDLVMEGDGLRFNASYFHTDADDFIDIQVTATTTRNVNIRRAQISGVEAELSYDSAYAFISAGYSRIRGEDINTGQPLDSIPADKIVAVMGGKLPQLDLLFGVTNEFAWEQDRVNFTLPTDGYNVHGVFASWVPSQEWLEGVRIDAGINNLFDESYRRHLSSEQAEGRDFYAAISYSRSF